jgi:hypothetical protein
MKIGNSRIRQANVRVFWFYFIYMVKNFLRALLVGLDPAVRVFDSKKHQTHTTNIYLLKYNNYSTYSTIEEWIAIQ